MNKEFVTYEQAIALKELGFDEPCLKMAMSEVDIINAERTDEGDYPKNSDLYSRWVAVPIYSQAFRWFREKYRLYPIIDSFVGVKGVVKFFYKLPMYDETFNTYEEAESACLDKLIEICKTK